ncbi:hypothetical protein NQ315_005109 [Exocentrus adspersus]|uniref:Uncharacterized protein n=1 Tax=Exocentrus adspersus TaxID=1586481 RepID=A0AAV8VUK1_9CUCU|nr:hypothetical protein NQ315_005109 [Exocentrus adspersus]
MYCLPTVLRSIPVTIYRVSKNSVIKRFEAQCQVHQCGMKLYEGTVCDSSRYIPKINRYVAEK